MHHRLVATVAACTLAITATVQTSTSSAFLTSTTDPTAGVVLIDTVLATGGEGAGTGMVLTASGQVLTNNHVVEGSTDITVTIPDSGSSYTATVLGVDETRDVALLQLEDAGGLTTVTIDDGGGVTVGDAVTAVGNANGEGEIVQASGAVTAVSSTVQVSDGTEVSSLSGMIETDAEAVPGDSGGAMVDAEGEVVGMTTAGGTELTAYPRRPQGQQDPQARQLPQGSGQQAEATTVSYAVPIATALSVVEQIRTGDESGTVQVGPSAYLGVSVTAAASGVGVVSVEDGSAAAGAGIGAGSVLTAVDGQRVTATSDVAEALAGHEPGHTITVAWTDVAGAAHEATVTLGESPVN